MTPQEQKQLEDFLVQLTHVGYVSKDPQAAEAVAAAFSRQPDAPYLIVQRCLLLSQALTEAYARIAALEKEQPTLPSTPKSAWTLSPGLTANGTRQVPVVTT